MIEFRHFVDAYCTHQPVLYEVLKNSEGKILELGCGMGSTQITNHFSTNRQVLTVENNKEWYEQYKQQFENKNHLFLLIKDWPQTLKNLLNEYDVIFVDQDTWESRLEAVKLFKNHANYIIVHDYDSLPVFLNYNWQDDYRYYQEFSPFPRPYPTGPPTVILSNRNKLMFKIDFHSYTVIQ